MLRYRVLLIDIEAHQERPVQAYFNNANDVRDWSQAMLKKASKRAYVSVYHVLETEKWKLTLDDQGSIQGSRPLEKEADQQIRSSGSGV